MHEECRTNSKIIEALNSKIQLYKKTAPFIDHVSIMNVEEFSLNLKSNKNSIFSQTNLLDSIY